MSKYNKENKICRSENKTYYDLYLEFIIKLTDKLNNFSTHKAKILKELDIYESKQECFIYKCNNK
jgi:hypothetical protein